MGEQAQPESMLWCRGLDKDPSSEWVFHGSSGSHHVENLSDASQVTPEVTGLVAIDGSLIGKYRGGGALGWGMAAADDNGSALVRHFGLVPVELPVQRRILRGELWSLLMLLRVMLPPVRAVSDNSTVVRGLAMGEAWCTSASRPHADVWRLIWFKIRDIGYGAHGVTVAKVKAHNSLRVIQELPRESMAQCLANREADVAAKFGAGLDHLELARSQAMSEASARVTGVLQYVASFLLVLRDGND